MSLYHMSQLTGYEKDGSAAKKMRPNLFIMLDYDITLGISYIHTYLSQN